MVGLIFADFAKAVAQLSDKRFRRVLWLGIGLTLALLFVAYLGLLQLVEWLDPGSVTIPGIGPITWIGDLMTFGSVFLMLFLSMFLMIPVASAITSLFLDDVAEAVEDRYYPSLPVTGRQPFWEGVQDTVNFIGVLIGANILALVAYSFLPFLSPFIFYALNGYLLGREYFIIAAIRREGRIEAHNLRKDHATEIWAAGILMALPLTIPIVNLLIPVLGAATFTHMYHRFAGTPRGR